MQLEKINLEIMDPAKLPEVKDQLDRLNLTKVSHYEAQDKVEELTKKVEELRERVADYKCKGAYDVLIADMETKLKAMEVQLQDWTTINDFMTNFNCRA